MKNSTLTFLLKILHRKLSFSRHVTYKVLRFINNDSGSGLSNVISSRKADNLDVSGLKHDGYVFLNLDNSANVEKLVSECSFIYREKLHKYTEDYFINNPKKRFLLTIDEDESLLSKQGVREYLGSDYILNYVYAYLNGPFVLAALRLWWSPVNESTLSSQMYHLDEEDTSQLKLLINISDVSYDHGPFTFLSSRQSEKVLSDYPASKRRYTDDEIKKSLRGYQHQSIIGPPGCGGFVDTSKCLHFGSRNNNKDRLVFMAQFLKADAPFLSKSLPLSHS